MIKLKSIEEANEVSAVRLVSKRQRAKVGDIFRLSPFADIFVWGRLIKRAKFFGLDAEFSLVYLYDAIGKDRPSADMLSPQNLIIGPGPQTCTTITTLFGTTEQALYATTTSSMRRDRRFDPRMSR
jgi:hypothetical protein